MLEKVLKKLANKGSLYFLLVFSFSLVNVAQSQIASYCSNPNFEDKIASTIQFSIPVLSVHELKQMDFSDIILLDARELEEYETSHIQSAHFFGYDSPNFESLSNIEKEKTIIVYCSIGYRSEKIGEKLQEIGFSNVYNLYGSIFEWSNAGYPIYDKSDKETKQIHTYNKKWSKWVFNEALEKVW